MSVPRLIGSLTHAAPSYLRKSPEAAADADTSPMSSSMEMVIALTSSLVAISLYVAPSSVSSHLSEVSFQRRATFADVPRSTSIPALVVGEPVTPLFRTMMLSSIARVSVLSVVVVPFTVRFPPTVTSPVVSTFAKVTDADVPTA